MSENHEHRAVAYIALTGNAILAGHPCSGTTLLEQVLAAHPQVADLDEKDVLKTSLQANLLQGRLEFFDLETLHEASNLQLAAARTDYLSGCSMLLGRLSKKTVLCWIKTRTTPLCCR